MEAAAALEKRERLVIGPRSGSSRRRTRSLRRVDGYGGRRVAVAAAPASAPSVSMASSAVDPSIWGLLEGRSQDLSMRERRGQYQAIVYKTYIKGIELVVRAGAWVVRAGAFSSRIELFDRCPSCPERSDWEHPGPNGRELSTSKRKPFYICNQQNMFDALRARYKWEIWLSNVPHTKLVQVKGHQNWVKVSGQYLLFPGGGTQFIHGALHYIDFLQQSVRGVAWGKRTRVVLDVGCGVASFGGYLFERDVVTMSFAPKDEHEAQVQMALERGIPAISAVMGSKRLPFPSKAFDLVHCARCRVPWHADGGALLLELNRVLRPGGLFVWSATPVYQKLTDDVEIWKGMCRHNYSH
uniref:Methyltransferase n=1 Tax=Aegilops tauschii subsp. strangulata TaxID=200361 RepID=A0A453SH27_AEGTS